MIGSPQVCCFSDKLFSDWTLPAELLSDWFSQNGVSTDWSEFWSPENSGFLLSCILKWESYSTREFSV